MRKRKHTPPQLATCSFELLSQTDAAGKTTPPSEFRIFPAGEIESHHGRFSFSPASSRRVMESAKKYGNDYSIDYQHGMFALLSANPAESAKAAGWFKPEIRDGSLWATQVSWTPKATEMLSNREYRYISPAFDFDEKKEIHLLRNVALTNVPAIFNLEPLLASWTSAGEPEEEEEHPTMKTLLALLGLAETASEAEAMAKLSQLQTPMTELLSFTGKPAAGDALAVIKAWKAAADSVPAMHAELSQLKTAAVDVERDALIADGKKRGVVPPAYEPVLKTMELSQLKEFLKVAVPVHAPKGKEASDGTILETVALSQQERDVGKLLGVTDEQMAKSKARVGGIVPVAVIAAKSA